MPESIREMLFAAGKPVRFKRRHNACQYESGDALHINSRHGEKGVTAHGEFVNRSRGDGSHPPVSAQSVLLKETDNGMGISNIYGEKHGGVPRKNEMALFRNGC